MSIASDNVSKSRILSRKLISTTRRIDQIIKEIAVTTETSNVYWSKLQKQINKEYEKLRAITKEFIEANIPKVYNEGLRLEIARLKNRKITRQFTNIKYRSYKNRDINKQSVRALLDETISSFETGYISGQKTLIRLLRTTQQVNVFEKQINRQIDQGFIDKGSVQGSIKNLKNELLKKSLDGKYITVSNKNGDPMRFKVNTYAELTARTKLQEANNLAVINTAQSVGADLVQWSAHNTTCAVCAPYEGLIFSLSGASKDFPSIEAVPPLHPRCLHSLTTVFEEALKIDGTYNDYVNFSNGLTEIHPTRESFIPLSKRTLI